MVIVFHEIHAVVLTVKTIKTQQLLEFNTFKTLIYQKHI